MIHLPKPRSQLRHDPLAGSAAGDGHAHAGNTHRCARAGGDRDDRGGALPAARLNGGRAWRWANDHVAAPPGWAAHRSTTPAVLQVPGPALRTSGCRRGSNTELQGRRTVGRASVLGGCPKECGGTVPATRQATRVLSARRGCMTAPQNMTGRRAKWDLHQSSSVCASATEPLGVDNATSGTTGGGWGNLAGRAFLRRAGQRTWFGSTEQVQ
jgi:hypothetical protein